MTRWVFSAPRWRDRRLVSLPSLIASVSDENHRQHGKWGDQIHAPSEWASIAIEEAGECVKELNEVNFGSDRASAIAVYEEAIQTATLFLKIAEMASLSWSPNP